MQIHIKNFQSIRDGEMSFPIGVSTIVGATNSGKTALIRAITSILTNPPEARGFITHGKDKTEVDMEYNENSIVWSRTAKDSYYDVNGELHQKIGKTDLFEFVNTGFYRTEDGEIINIQDEWSPLFPFGRTDSQMYKLFEDVFCINDSTIVLSKIKADESESKKDIVSITQNYNRTLKKIDKLGEFLLDLDIDTMSDYRSRFTLLNSEVSDLNSSVGIVQKDIKTVSSISSLKIDEIDMTCFDRLNETDIAYRYMRTNINLLNLDKMENIDFSVFKDVEDLDKSVRDLDKSLRILNVDIDVPVIDTDIFNEVVELESEQDKVVQLLREIKDINVEMDGIDSELEEVKDKLDSLKVCPLCGSNIKKG
jgi:exonuclease SbcC